ncbi:hypothetical protein JCM21900_002425 [Sporobolomyces salmonicolor]
MRSTSVLWTLFLLFPTAFAFPTPGGSNYSTALDGVHDHQDATERIKAIRATSDAVLAFKRSEQEDDDEFEVVKADETIENLEVTEKQNKHLQVENVQVEVLTYNLTQVGESVLTRKTLESKAEMDDSLAEDEMSDTDETLNTDETLDKELSFEDIQFMDIKVNATRFDFEGDSEVQFSEEVLEEKQLKEED